MRKIGIGLTAALLVAAVAAPALATQPDPDTGLHKVWICHRTLSDTNPWVVIPVDYATWDPSLDQGAEGTNGHQRPHNKPSDIDPFNDVLIGDVIKGEPKPSKDDCPILEE